MILEDIYDQHFTKQGYGVELGVWWGGNAKVLLDTTWPRHMLLVDRFDLPVLNYETDPLGNETPKEAKKRMKHVHNMFNIPTVTVCRALTRPAIHIPHKLDWIYIDANHLEVYDDLVAWWPLIKSGGMLAGHDYVIGSHYIEVVPQVHRFREEQGDAVGKLIITDDPGTPSWAFEKRYGDE